MCGCGTSIRVVAVYSSPITFLSAIRKQQAQAADCITSHRGSVTQISAHPLLAFGLSDAASCRGVSLFHPHLHGLSCRSGLSCRVSAAATKNDQVGCAT